MSANRKHVLDANIFIQAKNQYYGFDICPGFWSSLLWLNRENRVFTIDRIQEELTDQKDNLADWISNEVPDSFFKKTSDQKVIDEFQKMMRWAFSEKQFTNAAKAEFAKVADGWVVAYAAVNGLVVVTHEEYAPEVKREVKVPNVCIEFGIEYLNTFEMLRELKVEFVRRTKRCKTS